MAFLDPILSPLLTLPPVVGIALISFIISLVITITYKYVTDQELMKRLKEEMKELQEKMKAHKDNPEKAMQIQGQIMEKTKVTFMHSMKPTLFTMLPILLIFGWLNTHMGYYPLMPGEEFTVNIELPKHVEGKIEMTPVDGLVIDKTEKKIKDGLASFNLSGDAGEYILEFKAGNESFSRDIVITEDRVYKKIKEKDNGAMITVQNRPVHPFNGFHIGSWYPGWLFAYILFSIIFSSILRKSLKVY